ncbi:MAG: hypothetical protein GOV15_00485, partial [Candidatus Diapherotrites archaeon]|nr:hypothetical protein [Candidatus Diapherotrites archaeon]
MKEVRTSAPGKLMIAGEYSVLHVGNPCLVAAVNVRVRTHLKPLENSLIFTIDDFNIKDKVARFENGKLVFDYASEDEKGKLIFLEHAVNNTLAYLNVKD